MQGCPSDTLFIIGIIGAISAITPIIPITLLPSTKKTAATATAFNHCKYYKPSSVPPKRPLSFIYDCGHPQPLATYPPTLDEQPLIVGIHGLATRKAYCRPTLLPPRWALTPPFHPYLPAEADIGGCSLLRYYTLTNIEPLTRAALCVARTFLPLHSRQR